MKTIFVSFFIFICLLQLSAQEKHRWDGYYMVPQIGLLNGDHAVSAQVMMVAGKMKKNTGIGIGAAIDYYKIRTVPVFIDLRKNFSLAGRPLFAYLNLGYNIASPLSSDYQQAGYSWFNKYNDRFASGFYSDMGFGYLFSDKSHKTFFISIGYTMKTITEKYDERSYNDFPPYNQYYDAERKFQYLFNRLVLKIGARL